MGDFVVGSIVNLRNQFINSHGHGVFGTGIDQTNMATIIAVGPQEYRLPEDIIAPILYQINNDEMIFLDVNDDVIDVPQGSVLVNSGERFSVYPIHMIELIPEEQNDWINNNNNDNNRSTISINSNNQNNNNGNNSNNNINVKGGRRKQKTEKSQKKRKTKRKIKKRSKTRRNHRTRK